MAEFGVITGGGTKDFGTGGPEEPHACTAYYHITVSVEYSEGAVLDPTRFETEFHPVTYVTSIILHRFCGKPPGATSRSDGSSAYPPAWARVIRQRKRCNHWAIMRNKPLVFNESKCTANDKSTNTVSDLWAEDGGVLEGGADSETDWLQTQSSTKERLLELGQCTCSPWEKKESSELRSERNRKGFFTKAELRDAVQIAGLDLDKKLAGAKCCGNQPNILNK